MPDITPGNIYVKFVAYFVENHKGMSLFNYKSHTAIYF